MLWLCIRLPALVAEALAASERAAIERVGAWACQWSSLVAYRLSDGTYNGAGDAVAASGEVMHRAAASAAPAATSAFAAPAATSAFAAPAAVPLLWLELGASATLFGGHAALLARIEEGLSRLGYSHHCALAPTPTAAALLTHAAAAEQRRAFTPAQLRTQLQSLPLSLLELPADTVAALHSAGLRRIGEVLALPPAALARRFGPPCCRYLARLAGAASDPRTGWWPPATYRARCEFEQEVHDTTVLLFPLQRLLQEFQGYLCARDSSVQRFTLELEHRRVPGGVTGDPGAPGAPGATGATGATGVSVTGGRHVTRVTIGLSSPARAAAQLLLLARERLQTLALAAPVRALQLAADEFTAPLILQADLFGREAQRLGELSGLLDRLRARLGEQAVQSCRCHADHRPERACKRVPPEPELKQACALPTDEPPRPAALLPGPQRIAAPRALLSGPERIESGWWDGADVRRDYYIARAADSARQWVFQDLADGGWYLQGLWV